MYRFELSCTQAEQRGKNQEKERQADILGNEMTQNNSQKHVGTRPGERCNSRIITD